jgi:hypothetical protein
MTAGGISQAAESKPRCRYWGNLETIFPVARLSKHNWQKQSIASGYPHDWRLLQMWKRCCMTSAIQCQKENDQWRYDLNNYKDARVIRGMIVVQDHLPEMPYSVADQPNRIANRRRQPKVTPEPETENA